MKLVQIERDALLRPLQAVTGIVEKRHTLPILSNVLIERTAGRLNLAEAGRNLFVSSPSTLAFSRSA